jgi:hypothetical protein
VTALAHFVERVADLHLSRFEEWFPSTFDWERLCADVPRMAERRGEPTPDLGDLEDRSRAVFRGAHLVTLAVFSAAADDEEDPELRMESLASPPTEEEETEFARLAEAHLEALEEALAGEETAVPDVARAAAMVGAAWPAVSQLLGDDETALLAEDATEGDILWGVARVAAALAALRWLAAERCVEGWPSLAD